MFEVSSGLSVTGADGPFILRIQVDSPITHRNHRLDGNTHPFFQEDAVATTTVVGYWWVFVHLAADTVPREFTNDAIVLLRTMTLHSIADVTKMIASHGLLYSEIETLAGGTQQLLDFLGNFADTVCVGGVAIELIKEYTAVDGDDVAFLKDCLGVGYAMHYNIIHRRADVTWERRSIGIGEVLERWDAPIVTDELFGNLVQLERRDTRSDMF